MELADSYCLGIEKKPYQVFFTIHTCIFVDVEKKG